MVVNTPWFLVLASQNKPNTKIKLGFCFLLAAFVIWYYNEASEAGLGVVTESTQIDSILDGYPVSLPSLHEL